MNTAVRIRPAGAADLDAVHAIEVASFADPWRREGFRDLVLGGAGRLVVAEAADGIVGFAVSYHAADEAEIANVAAERHSGSETASHRQSTRGTRSSR